MCDINVIFSVVGYNIIFIINIYIILFLKLVDMIFICFIICFYNFNVIFFIKFVVRLRLFDMNIYSIELIYLL